MTSLDLLDIKRGTVTARQAVEKLTSSLKQ